MEQPETSAPQVRSYTRDNLRILWRPDLCIHAGVCVRTLPDVYHPREIPWVTPENASVDALVAQIDRCPSGALSYEFIDLKKSL